MPVGRLDQHHVKSLARLVGEWDNGRKRWTDGRLEDLLRDMFPVGTSHGEIDIGEVCWKGPYWMAAAERPQWVRTFQFHVSVNGSGAESGQSNHPEPKVWLSPLWPIGDEAAMVSDWLKPGVRIGRASLIDGRPLVPLRQRSYKPGLHVLRNDNCVGGRRLVLVPDAGASLLIHPTAMSKRGYKAAILGQFLLGSGSRRPVATFGDADEEHSDGWEDFFEHFDRLVGRHGHPPTAYFSVATAANVKAILGKYPDVSRLDDYWHYLKRLHDDGDSELPDLEHESSDEVLVTKDYGDLLREVIVESVLAAVRELHELDPEAPILRKRKGQHRDSAKAVELAKRINGQFYRRYRHMQNGGEHAGTRYPALVVGVDDRNTLADLEQRRKVTRYSAEIGTDTSHWIWTRGIHSRDRHRLCPLQTPESEDIGYVRFLALGVGKEPDDVPGDMSDLSAAASLIPFVNHNDPARASIGSKNLKQALPIEGASRPRVQSGTETLIAEAHGVVRMGNVAEATVTDVLEDRVVAEAGGTEFCVLFGPPGPTGFWVDGRWKPAVKVDQSVRRGDLVAHAPDVVIDDGPPALALGTDVLVAYTPWHGMNYEDAVVVSESIKQKFTSVHLLSIRERCSSQTEFAHAVVSKEDPVAKDDVLAWILSMSGERLRAVKAPEDGEVDLVDDQDSDGITIRLRTRRPLAVGDKLTNRHGGKCIVSKILPASEMPELPDGRKVEMLLNPLGVIKRLNVGQLLETHVSLLDDLTPDAQLEPVGRQFGSEQRRDLAEALRERGAPGGRLKLKCADGTVLDRHGGVVVGWQYMVKLDHLAIDKRTERWCIGANPRDRQPAKGRRWQSGRRRGGALRTGEMEIWALLASGADAFLNETLTERSRLSRDSNATLDSVKAHLAVGQIGIDPDSGEIRLLDSRDTLSRLVEDEKGKREDEKDENSKDEDADDEDAKGKREVWLEVPSTYSYVPDQDSDVLYREGTHGSSEHERSKVQFHVKLDIPIRHPWFGWSKKVEEEARHDPFPEDENEAKNRKERQKRALKAARAAGREPTLGLSLDDGLMVALCREKDGEKVWVSTPDESWVRQLWGTRPTLLDHAKDLMVDGHRKRAFVLSPAMYEGQVTELDLNTGEFVRNWVANPYRQENADGAEWITPSERGWPVLWGREIGRFDCVPMLHAIPILPPAYRVFDRDWLDRRYRDLFHTLILMHNPRPDEDPSDYVKSQHARILAGVVRRLLGSRNDRPDAQTISGRLNSKTGLLRRGLRGRHNNSVARSVIAPDTSLKLEQVGLPGVTMDELGLEEGEVVVVNRQPTLRPSNVIALSAYRHDGDHVALHPLMAKQLAGDFDGDEVTVHCPVSKGAANEAWKRLRPTAALLSDANGEPIMKPDLDVTLGLHLLSSRDDGHDQLREFFRLRVPEATAREQEEFFEPHVPRAMTGEQAEKLVASWYRQMMVQDQPDRPTRIRRMFELATGECVGWSASLLELERMKIKDGPGIDDGEAFKRMVEAAGNETVGVPGWMLEAWKARAAGKSSGLKQLLVCRGEHRTFTGVTHDKIESCFLDGLTCSELFETAPAALEKLAQKKLVTPMAGVLTKRLADAMYEVTVTKADCGSRVKNRTPLYCEEENGCCQACIGELVSGRIPDVNERLGLRAAMLIGERCTQDAMNAFHSGGTHDTVEQPVKELEAAFGQRSRHPVKGLSFDEVVNTGRLSELAQQVGAVFREEHKGTVHDDRRAESSWAVLASFVLRQLAERRTTMEPVDTTRAPLRAAAISGDPLLDASITGELRILLDAIQRDVRKASGLKATQVYHGLDVLDNNEDCLLSQDTEGPRWEAGLA